MVKRRARLEELNRISNIKTVIHTISINVSSNKPVMAAPKGHSQLYIGRGWLCSSNEPNKTRRRL